MCTKNVFTVFIVFFFTGLFFTGCENPVQTRGPAGTKYALVMEGGGVRGIIAAQFLKLLEEQVLNSLGEERNTTPEFFDFISGSSIGGIHALFLASDRSKAPEELTKLLEDEKGEPLEISGASLLNLYTHENGKNIKDIFKPNESTAGLPYGFSSTLSLFSSFLNLGKSNEFLKGAFQGLIYPDKGKVLARLFGDVQFGSLTKPVFIPTYDYANHKPRYFSSYDSSDNTVKVWELAEATSAAPIYFSPVTVTKTREDGKEEKMHLMDGTLMSNNTCISVYNELVDQFPNDFVKILSVSSGYFVKKFSDDKVKDWEKDSNVVSWVLGDGKLIERLVSVPSFLSTSTCKRVLKDNFMHIDFRDVPVTDIDDIKDETLEKLKKGARDEFENIKNDLRTFLLPDTL